MSTIRRTTATPLGAVALVVGPTLLSAHEVTHNGTVVALKTAKYAQPNGGSCEVRELEVAHRRFEDEEGGQPVRRVS